MTSATEPSLASISSSMLAGYPASSPVFDEMRDSAGKVRPHWEPLLRGMGKLGREGVRERSDSVRQLLREHGVTYNVHADGQSAARTWELDLLPLIIDAAEWSKLETGLIQRTKLLNLVLADIY